VQAAKLTVSYGAGAGEILASQELNDAELLLAATSGKVAAFDLQFE
jgi:hypothetical protein